MSSRMNLSGSTSPQTSFDFIFLWICVTWALCLSLSRFHQLVDECSFRLTCPWSFVVQLYSLMSGSLLNYTYRFKCCLHQKIADVSLHTCTLFLVTIALLSGWQSMRDSLRIRGCWHLILNQALTFSSDLPQIHWLWDLLYHQFPLGPQIQVKLVDHQISLSFDGDSVCAMTRQGDLA